jgi:transketolase
MCNDNIIKEEDIWLNVEQEESNENTVNIEELERNAIKKAFEKMNEVDGIVTVEDHQVAGGMGSAVSEFLSQNNPTKIEFIGVQDKFGQSGEPEELIKHYRLDSDSIKKAVQNVLK